MTNPVILLHMDGADASTTFTDTAGKTWTAAGNAQIDTAQSKFGGASGLFDGTGDWINTPDHADFTLGSGNFTFDCWVKRSASGVIQRIAGQSDSTPNLTSVSFWAYMDTANKILVAVYSGTTAYQVQGTTALDTGWHHIAAVRNGNNFNFYLDGTAEGGTTSVTGVTVNDSSNKWAVGTIGELTATPFNGWIDEVRFSPGIARWTANFTPPDGAYHLDQSVSVAGTLTSSGSLAKKVLMTLTGTLTSSGTVSTLSKILKKFIAKGPKDTFSGSA